MEGGCDADGAAGQRLRLAGREPSQQSADTLTPEMNL